MIYLSKIFSWFAFIKRPDEPILAKILAFGPLLSFGVFFHQFKGAANVLKNTTFCKFDQPPQSSQLNLCRIEMIKL